MASVVTPQTLTVCLPCPGCAKPWSGPSLSKPELYAQIRATPGRATCGACGERFFIDTIDPFNPASTLRESVEEWFDALDRQEP